MTKKLLKTKEDWEGLSKNLKSSESDFIFESEQSPNEFPCSVAYCFCEDIEFGKSYLFCFFYQNDLNP